MQKLGVDKNFNQFNKDEKNSLGESISKMLSNGDVLVYNKKIMEKEDLFDIVIRNKMTDEKTKYSGIERSKIPEFVNQMILNKKNGLGVSYFIIHKQKID